jgi:hypothetical protein
MPAGVGFPLSRPAPAKLNIHQPPPELQPGSPALDSLKALK